MNAIKYLSIIAFGLGILMASLDIYKSWSEHEGHPEEPLLNATLLAIIITFVLRAVSFEDYRQRVYSAAVAGLFSGVLIFSVNHQEIWVQNLHLIFTGAGICTAYAMSLVYFENYSPPFWGSVAGTAVGIFLFLGGYWFNWYTVGTGEVLAAWPIIIFVLGTNK